MEADLVSFYFQKKECGVRKEAKDAVLKLFSNINSNSDAELSRGLWLLCLLHMRFCSWGYTGSAIMHDSSHRKDDLNFVWLQRATS